MKFIQRLLMITWLGFSSGFMASDAWAASSFPTCAANATKKPLDDFCPKIEGQPLARCCPVKTVKVSCTFHKESTYTVNESGSVGGGCAESPAQSCCTSSSRTCQSESITVIQDRPVMFRGDGCCALECEAPGPEWKPGTIEECSGSGGGGSEEVGSCSGPSCSSLTVPTCPGIPPVNPPTEPPEEPGTPPQPPAPPVPGGNG